MGHPDGTTVRYMGRLRQIRVCFSWRRKTYRPLEPPWKNTVNIELMSKQRILKLEIKSSSRQNGYPLGAILPLGQPHGADSCVPPACLTFIHSCIHALSAWDGAGHSQSPGDTVVPRTGRPLLSWSS